MSPSFLNVFPLLLLGVLCFDGKEGHGSNTSSLSFPTDFQALYDVYNSQSQRRNVGKEKVQNADVTLTFTNSKDSLIQKCTYSQVTGFGHKISGISCKASVGFPSECYCQGKLCDDIIIPLSELLNLLSSFGTFQEEKILHEKLSKMSLWKVEKPQHKILFFLMEKEELGSWTPWKIIFDGLLPESQDGQNISLEYQILSFHPLSKPEYFEEALANDGVFCPRPDIYKRQIPNIPDQFSVSIETADHKTKSIRYTEQSFDLHHKLISFKYAPTSFLVHPSLFLSRFSFSGMEEWFNIIYDFERGYQYTLNQRTGNCSIVPIPDITSSNYYTDVKHSRLKHAKEILESSSVDYQYSGKRRIRGILCDVWVSENEQIDLYITTEIYFSSHEWNFSIDEIQNVQEIPIGMTTYTAKRKNSTKFDNHWTSHYYSYNPSEPSWNDFSISSCLQTYEPMYLKLTLEVSYNQLIQFSLNSARDAIRSSIADLARVSPLHVSDVHLSSTLGDHEGIDVWFILFSAPNEKTNTKTYVYLSRITGTNDIALTLRMDQNNNMIVVVRRNSLELSTDSRHPSQMNGGKRYYRASYTSGSMAGLGFSMALLGICVGIFLGFLLWRRPFGIPYILSS